MAALRRAHAWDWVESLPDGLDTPVGDEGALVSGGERQRIALARAFLSGASLLVLDEPTAHLDDETADGAARRPARRSRRRTGVLLITHSPLRLERFDTVLELVDGRLAQFSPPSSSTMRSGRRVGSSDRRRSAPPRRSRRPCGPARRGTSGARAPGGRPRPPGAPPTASPAPPTTVGSNTSSRQREATTDSGKAPLLASARAPRESARCRSTCGAPGSPARRARSGAAGGGGGGPARRRADRGAAGSRRASRRAGSPRRRSRARSAARAARRGWYRSSAPKISSRVSSSQSVAYRLPISAPVSSGSRSGGRPTSASTSSSSPTMFVCAMSRS